MATNSTSDGVSRRSFLQTVGLSAAGAAMQARLAEAEAAEGASGAGAPTPIGPGRTVVALRVNGVERKVEIEPATTLLDALRRGLDTTGPKEICDRGACGGCSVLVDGALVVACMMLALDAVGREVTTVEGLAEGDSLDPVQEAFVRHDALQCGYCTPGLVMASRALLHENPRPSVDEIKRGLAGNLCRCGTYTNVINAVLDASGQAPLVDGGAA